MAKVLFISNGHGEDWISSKIIRAFIQNKKGKEVYVLPMVGRSKIFDKTDDIKVIGPQKETNSGGFVKSISAFLNDLFSGVLFIHFKQIKNAKKNNYDLVVCVGDFFPFILTFLFIRPKNIVLVSTAKSDLFEPHFWLERLFFKIARVTVFARDKTTADNLTARGITALYKGNVMMDDMPIRRKRKELSNQIVLGVLPGSRAEAYTNYELMKEVIAILPKDWIIKVAVPSNLEKIKFLIQGNENVHIVDFETMLKQTDIVVGFAGTANEQVIGSGIPLITFPGKGPQTTQKRFLDQKKLLGDLPVFIDSSDSSFIAKTIISKSKDVSFRNHVSVNGPKVMGKPGSSVAIAEYINSLL